ncbi:MAG: hypothetical protein ABI650_09760 [Dokdonella sp.]
MCALALDPVSTLLQEAPTAVGERRAPSAGYCQFTAQEGSNGRGPISVMVMTSASIQPDDLSRSAAVMLAEAEQTYGDAGSSECTTLAKLAVTFNSAPGNAQQVVIGERGVLMEIGLGSGGFQQEQVAALVNDVWSRVLAYQPPKP